jgi:hypothetical protein
VEIETQGCTELHHSRGEISSRKTIWNKGNMDDVRLRVRGVTRDASFETGAINAPVHLLSGTLGTRRTRPENYFSNYAQCFRTGV